MRRITLENNFATDRAGFFLLTHLPAAGSSPLETVAQDPRIIVRQVVEMPEINRTFVLVESLWFDEVPEGAFVPQYEVTVTFNHRGEIYFHYDKVKR